MKDFSEIYSEYHPRTLRFACNFVESEQDAQNIVHDVFMDLWIHRDTIEEIQNLNAYLFRLTRNRCLDFLKHQAHEKAYLQESINNSAMGEEILTAMTDREVLIEELSSLVNSCIENLPQRSREIFILSRREGLRHSEIAEKLGVSANTVNVQLGIALRRIRSITDRYFSSSL